MKSPTPVLAAADAASDRHAPNGLGPLGLLALSAWCGLLEVGAIVLRKQTLDPNHLYGMSRHFFPPVYGLAWLIVALGISSRVVPALETRARGCRRLVRASFPILACVVSVLAVCLASSAWIKQWRERSRPLPPPPPPTSC